MISFAIVKPEYNIHLVDAFGVIIDSSIHVKEILGTYAADYIDPADVIAFLHKLHRTAYDDISEFCTYTVRDQLMMGKFELVGEEKIQIIEWNITGLDMQQVWQLPW